MQEFIQKLVIISLGGDENIISSHAQPTECIHNNFVKLLQALAFALL